MKEEVTTETCPWAAQDLSVERVAEARLPTEVGEFRIAGYRSRTSDEEFVVLFKGDLRPEIPTLVRIHSQCLTGDVFGSIKCDCGRQLKRAMELIERQFELRTAIATKAVEYVARQALRMNTNQQRPKFRARIAQFEPQRFFGFVLANAFKAVYTEFSEASREVCFGDLIQLEAGGNDVTNYYRSRRCSPNNNWPRCC